MDSKNEKYVAIIISIIAIILTIFMTLHDERARSNELAVLSNPSFVGEVVGKESVLRHAGGGMLMRHTEYRLHIVGQYLENYELRQVDRVFTVPRSFYAKYNIGDIISHELVYFGKP